MKNIKIKEWYLDKYCDDMGRDIRDHITFEELNSPTGEYTDVYDFLGVGDSIVRERCYDELAKLTDQSYEGIFDKWVGVKARTDMIIPDGIYTVVEGSYDDGLDFKIYPLSHDGFEQAYEEALAGWNNESISKCWIYLVEDDKVLTYRRPDMLNFAYRERDGFTPMYFEDTYILAKETEDSFRDIDYQGYTDLVRDNIRSKNFIMGTIHPSRKDIK